MSWRGEVEDGIGHDGLAPPSKAQQRRNTAIDADQKALFDLADQMRMDGYPERVALLRRVGFRLSELLR